MLNLGSKFGKRKRTIKERRQSGKYDILTV